MKIIYTNNNNETYSADLARYETILLFADKRKNKESVEYTETLELLAEQIPQTIENFAYYKNLGLVAQSLGFSNWGSDLSLTYYKLATKYLGTASQLDHNDSDIWYQLARCKKMDKDNDGAYDDILKAIDKLNDPEGSTSLAILADYHLIAQQLATALNLETEAEQHKQSLAEISAELSEIAYLKAQEHSVNNEWQQALLSYDLAIDYDPNNLLACIGKTYAYFQLEEGVNEECFQFVYSHESADSAILTKAGKACIDFSCLEGAKAFLEKALELDATNTEAKYHLEQITELNQTNPVDDTIPLGEILELPMAGEPTDFPNDIP